MSIIIQHEGDTWEIIGQGALRDGKVYCHLASKTRVRQQRNGENPVQIADWIDQNVILSAAIQAEEEQRRQHAADLAQRRADFWRRMSLPIW